MLRRDRLWVDPLDLATAVFAGLITWALFLTTARLSWDGSSALGVDEAGIYSRSVSFFLQVWANNILVVVGMVFLAWYIGRRGSGRTWPLGLIALGLTIALWSLRGGLEAGSLGLSGDLAELALASAPHMIAEVALLLLPVIAVMSRKRLEPAMLATCVIGLGIASALETLL